MSCAQFAARCFAWPRCCCWDSPCARGMTVGISVNPDRVRPSAKLVAAICVTSGGGSTVSNITFQAQVPVAG